MAADNVWMRQVNEAQAAQCQIHALFDKAGAVPSEGALGAVRETDIELATRVRPIHRRFACVDAAGDLNSRERKTGGFYDARGRTWIHELSGAFVTAAARMNPFCMNRV